VLCVYRETIADALDTLEARGLLTYTTHETGITFTLRPPEDVSFLQDTVQQRIGNRARSVIVSEEPAPLKGTLPSARHQTSNDVLGPTVTREKIATELRK
jgi:hypothetical protein